MPGVALQAGDTLMLATGAVTLDGSNQWTSDPYWIYDGTNGLELLLDISNINSNTLIGIELMAQAGSTFVTVDNASGLTINANGQYVIAYHVDSDLGSYTAVRKIPAPNVGKFRFTFSGSNPPTFQADLQSSW